MIQPGDILEGIYRVDKEIGQGGVGIIYLGYHLRLRLPIVIKKIKDNYVGRIQERGEADVLKQLHHTNLPQVYDFVQRGNEIFTVMEYVEGKNLGYFIENQIRPKEEQVVQWMKQICEVLNYLHTRKPAVLHNDIKPKNIMLRPDGLICLLDFNISFNKDSGEVSGYNRRYSSPELILESQSIQNGSQQRVVIDERSDLYSLGATMYHLVSGVSPQAGDPEIVPLECMDLPYSKEIMAIISKAMNVVKEERYASAEEILADLIRIGKSERELEVEKKQQTSESLSGDMRQENLANTFHNDNSDNLKATKAVQILEKPRKSFLKKYLISVALILLVLAIAGMDKKNIIDIRKITGSYKEPNVQECIVHGLEEPLEMYANTLYPFTVMGAGCDNINPIEGDIKWEPRYWSAYSFPEEDEINKYWQLGSSRDILKEGEKSIYIFFEKMLYKSEEWEKTGTYENVEYPFFIKQIGEIREEGTKYDERSIPSLINPFPEEEKEYDERWLISEPDLGVQDTQRAIEALYEEMGEKEYERIYRNSAYDGIGDFQEALYFQDGKLKEHVEQGYALAYDWWLGGYKAYLGNFKDGKFHGKGVYFDKGDYANTTYYIVQKGTWKNGKGNGYFEVFQSEGKIQDYEFEYGGTIKDDLWDGDVEFSWKNTKEKITDSTVIHAQNGVFPTLYTKDDGFNVYAAGETMAWGTYEAQSEGNGLSY